MIGSDESTMMNECKDNDQAFVFPRTRRLREIKELLSSMLRELKSTIQKTDIRDSSKCLLRFNNCTPYRVTPYWIDFRGLPIKYETLNKGTSMNIDTHALHLWYFKAEVPNDNPSNPVKILALTEETFQPNIKPSGDYSTLHNFNSPLYLSPQHSAIETNEQMTSYKDTLLSVPSSLICPLCKMLIKKKSVIPAKIPCPHFTGEAKYSLSDFDGKLSGNYSSTYIYSCTETTHKKNHVNQRRNIYLVEPFFSLRERCFLVLKETVPYVDIVDLDIPRSLLEDFFKFSTTLKKLNERN